jgi:hypothetical protein
MINLKNNELVISIPEVHENAVCAIEFQRTLRIPDDNREYPLPPGLGGFPLEHVKKHAARVPPAWVEHGGILMPMYQAEAMWISFSSRGHPSYPFAIKIAAGKINAVTGDAWDNDLHADPQDYVVIPEQPWLDGFCVQKGLIRQFVAMPLGKGYTAEEQLTGAAEHGGLQIIAFPMKRERYEALLRKWEEECARAPSPDDDLMFCLSADEPEMGLAAGGLMRQEIYEDPYGIDAWDTTHARCFVHILNSAQWQTVTGTPAPGQPPTAADYTNAGLPWFEHYDDRLTALPGSKVLAGLDSVAAKGIKLGEKPLPENEPVTPGTIIQTGPTSKVDDGKW